MSQPEKELLNEGLKKLLEAFPNKEDPEKLAQLKQEFCRIDQMFPVPLDTICKALGIEATNANLDPSISGKIYKKNNSYRIEASVADHPNKRRFTIAHELGHYALHQQAIERGEILERKDERILDYDLLLQEAEANGFAAALLMPQIHFIHKYQEYYQQNDFINGDYYEKLSRYFFVSQTAIAFRTLRLGLASHI